MVGRGGLEPPTSRLSGVRSNHLSYRPMPWGRRREWSRAARSILRLPRIILEGTWGRSGRPVKDRMTSDPVCQVDLREKRDAPLTRSSLERR